ncbi:MAG: acyl-CoA dehydrogenase family protein [Sphingomicrobium sp.]
MSDLETFRTQTRAWLEGNCPAEMRTPIRSEADICWGGRNWAYRSDAQRRWLEAMAERGWTVPEWPKDYGGGDLSPEEARVLKQEMARIGARTPLTSFGISMLGPALLKFGTEEQKKHYLPQIARGEIRWCQGYSEPGAGSDLAALQTKAEDKGDHWLVNGQKVWTSYADKADWIFCLVRTSSESKQGGISFLLFDMETPGVSTKPILLISGSSPFCETFFDDVKVPKEQIVGEVNKGWDVAKYLLGHEREMIAGMGLGTGGTSVTLGPVVKPSDPLLRAEIAAFDVDALAFAAMSERFAAMWKAREAHPASPSMMKYAGTELNKRRTELAMAGGGSDALEWDSERSRGGSGARSWLRSKGNSIEGGTSEIQLNIVAKHILRLPGA